MTIRGRYVGGFYPSVLLIAARFAIDIAAIYLPEIQPAVDRLQPELDGLMAWGIVANTVSKKRADQLVTKLREVALQVNPDMRSQIYEFIGTNPRELDRRAKEAAHQQATFRPEEAV